MMSELHEKKHSGFGNGFVLGLIVGALLVFLLGTKSGRKILKQLTEKGSTALQGLNLDNVDEYHTPDVPESGSLHQTNSHATSHEKSSPRRFFKNPKK